MKKIEIKIAPRKIINYSYFALSLLTAAIIFSTSLFLYQNFYQTITESEEILALREKVAIEAVDIKKFEKIIKKIEEKTVPLQPEPLNNPFD